MINLVMALNVCPKVHCTLTLFERERWRDLSQMLSIQPIGQIAVHIAVSLIDLPLYGKFWKEFPNWRCERSKNVMEKVILCNFVI